jgi:hypothetical protein
MQARTAAAILEGLGADRILTEHRAEPWEHPVPLTARRFLPRFPVDALPGWVADQVWAVAEFTQTPPDLAGCVALAALSTAAGGRAVVEVRSGWREPVNLFVVVALPPGSRKSAVFAAMTAPLLQAERDLVARVRPQIIETELAKKVAERSAERSAAAAAGASEAVRMDSLAQATDSAMHAASIDVPVLPRLIADDVTPEAAASLLCEQGGRLAVLSAEGGIFATMAGRYSSGAPNLEVFLKGHAGDLLRVDRKGRPAEHVDHPALTLGLAVQPEILTQIATLPGFRGRGLLARILFSLPENTVGRRRIGTDPVPAHTASAYATHLVDLVRALADDGDQRTCTLTPQAADAMLDLERAIEPRLGPGGDLAHLCDWGSKLVGATARIAALVHLADHGGVGEARSVDSVTVDAAAQLSHYVLAHALAAYEHMGADPRSDDAQHVLDWIIRTRTARFTKRELFSSLTRGRFRKVGDLYPALELLDSHGHIRREPELPHPGGPGRRPSPAYLVHPLHHSAISAESAQRQSADSADIAETSRPFDPHA